MTLQENLHFTYYSPAGNDTILVDNREGGIPKSEYPVIASALLSQYKKAEQVGFYRLNGASSDQKANGNASAGEIVLEMAGGEFCGNASLCAGVHLLSQCIDAPWQPGETKTATVIICNRSLAVDVVKQKDGTYVAEIGMPSPIGQQKAEFFVGGQRVCADLILFDGIGHIILTKQYPKRDLENAIRTVCDEFSLPSLGFMTYLDGFLTPLVYVKQGNTLYWENSCASGSTALSFRLAEQNGGSISVALPQPGGTIAVTVSDGTARMKNTVAKVDI